MIVGVIAVPMMQMPVMDEIHVIAMLDAQMLFVRMAVRMIVGGDAGHQFLGIGVRSADLDRMLINMPAVGVVKVPVVKIINMAAVIDGLMAAAFGMGMGPVPAVKHLMRHGGRSNQGKRQDSAVKGSMHHSALRKTIPPASYTIG